MESCGGGGGVNFTGVDRNTGEVNVVDHVGDDDNSSDGSDQITVIIMMTMDLHALNDRYIWV